MNIAVATLFAVDRYIDMLDQHGVEPELLADTDPTNLKHILWMCLELKQNIIPGSPDSYSVDKYSRWLGFIQAVIIMAGLTTVKAERDITRPWFKGATLD